MRLSEWNNSHKIGILDCTIGYDFPFIIGNVSQAHSADHKRELLALACSSGVNRAVSRIAVALCEITFGLVSDRYAADSMP